MEFKKRIFLLPSFGNFEQICKYLFPLVCLYFIFISFFLFLSTNNLQENISIREEFYIYLFIYSFLSLDGKLSDRRNIRKIEIVKTSLVKYPFHPFPLYFYRASHRKIILSLWRNGGKNNSCSLRSVRTLSASINNAILLSRSKENLEEFSTNLKSLLLARRNCEKDGEGMERGRKGPKRI